MIENGAQGWSPDDVEIAKQEFVDSRPAVSRGLVRALWNYWKTHGSNAPLFEDPVQNVALLTHARAYGESVPQAGDRSALGRLLDRHQDLIEPVAPVALAWGPRANLSTDAWPAMESPIMDVWIYRDGPLPSGVLIIGEGLPEIRAQILPKAFLASLGMGTLDSDLVNNGAIRVELPLAGRPPLQIPVNLLGSHSGVLPGDVSGTARDALVDLVRDLRLIADSTGLVRLHNGDVDAPTHLHQSVLGRAVRRTADPLLWAPRPASTTAGNPTGDTESGEVAALIPVTQIPSGAALQVRLSGELLATSSYRMLEQVYRRNTIDRIKTDVRLRMEFNHREADRLDRDHEAYKSTPEESRAAMWGDKVILSVRYDEQADYTIHIAPIEEDCDTYYIQNLPGLAQGHRTNAQKMGRILESIETAEGRPDSPVRRLTAGRMLDAAIRGGEFADNPSLSTAFTAWSAQIQPMLWMELRSQLAQSGIDPADVFTRNTVIHTVQTEGDRGTELLLVPHAVVHQRRSAVLFDRRRRVTVVHDRANAARRADRLRPDDRTMAGEAARERLRQLARTARPAEDEVDGAVRELLIADPAESIAWLLGELTASTSAEAAGSLEVAQLVTFDEALAKATEKTFRLRAFRRAVIALMRGAPQTARASIERVGTENALLGVRAALLEAALEYSEAGGDTRTGRELAAGIGPGGGERVREALERARQLDATLDPGHKGYVDHWISVLETVDFSTAVGRLQQGLRSLEELHDDRMAAAWAARGAVETARIARTVEIAADSLNEDGEPVAMALAKLGAALEESFLDDFAGANRDAAHSLMSILQGDERPFGRNQER